MIKRILDFLLSFILIILLLPFMLPIMLVLKLTGEHYIFYLQPRVGKHGKEFNMFKFSTMLLDSPNLGTGEITLKKDPRVFPFGRILRKTKINEIPQIINILTGDMSFVGPRPLTPKHFNFYSDDQKKIITRMRPGLTGLGSIIFRDEEGIFEKSKLSHEECYRQNLSPVKAALEQYYWEHKSLWTDAKIVFSTAWVILFKNSSLPYKLFKGLPEKPLEIK